VAAHETGHAIQHAHAYAPLAIRNGIFPVARFGSSLGYILFFIGLFFGGSASNFLLDLGIILFSFFVFFTVLTLPVEFNASSRALRTLSEGGYLRGGDELYGARKVLSAAAMTYVAAAATAIMNLLRMLLIRGSRDE
jgi:Zn-dependent membrane protease YugP